MAKLSRSAFWSGFGALVFLIVASVFGLLPVNQAATSPKSTPPARVSPGVRFSFTVKNDVRTSAGVFAKDGTLIRTLWSGVSYKAGTYAKSWDGRDDEGRLAPNGNYEVKVLSNDVKYTWEGVIGNTSGQFAGPTVHRGWEGIRSMAIVDNIVYYAKGYSEGTSSQSKFSVIDPQAEIGVLATSKSGQGSVLTATDGKNVYWAGYDAFAIGGQTWFIFATKAGSDNEHEFLNGSSLKLARGYTYKSSIAVAERGASTISGLAVQKKAGYLFVACKELNELRVYDKTTGYIVRTLSVKSPGGLCVDKDDNLWMISGVNRAHKYAIRADGLLSGALVSLPDLVEPLALAVSPTTNVVVVADGGASQQLKAYNDATGAAVWTYGLAGGYAKNALVANDKFYFTDTAGRNTSTFVAFQADGSFWVGDTGNGRAMHYAADRTFIDCVMYLPRCYSSFVDNNKPNRVFADYLEFNVDYTKPLGPTNNSWMLTRNWGSMIPADYDSQYHRLRGVTTLSNGRTYALLAHNSTKKFHLVELLTSGSVRLTGIETEDFATQLYQDGSLRRTVRASGTRLGQPQLFTKRMLTGFDANNNPIWSAQMPLATTPPTTLQDPIFWGNTGKFRAGEMTTSNIVVAFDGGLPPNGGSGYHLGGIRLGATKWLWRTALSTPETYGGPYPTDGAYDNGNEAKYGGSVAIAAGRHIVWGYHGEFWKNSQTNKWNHVFDNGLLVGTFGITGPEVAGQEAPAMMAGNAFSPSLITDNDGNMYLYHNDEGHHAGLHRWKISGLSSVQEQVIPVTQSSEAGGLTGFYFESPDLNNLTLKTTRIDPRIDFNWTAEAVPAGTRLTKLATYSVRWKGFLEGGFSEKYTIFVKASKGIRLWIDEYLYIDAWPNATSIEHTAAVSLEAGKRHAIRIESKGGGPVTLLWASARQAKSVISSQFLYSNLDQEDSIKYDLLYGLPYSDVLPTNYGWQRDPVAEDYTNQYSDWWQAITNRETYRRQSPDLWVKFRQATGTYTISRSLGAVHTRNSWSLTGRMSYDGNEGNSVNAGSGCFVDVLDKAGKIIARTFVAIDYNGRIMTVYGNASPIATAPQAIMRPIIDQQQPIQITASSGGITFAYAHFPPVTAPVYDLTSDWQSPQTVRLYFVTEGRNSDRIIDIERLYFFAGDVPPDVSQDSLLAYPNPTQSYLTVEHAAVAESGTLTLVAMNGKTVAIYSLALGSTSDTIDMGFLPPGTYVLVFRDGRDKSTARVVKY